MGWKLEGLAMSNIVDGQPIGAFDAYYSKDLSKLNEVLINGARLHTIKDKPMQPNTTYNLTTYEKFLFEEREPYEIDFSYTLNNFGHRCDNFMDEVTGEHFLFAGCSFTFGEGLPYKKNWSGIVYEGLSLKYNNIAGYYALGYCGGSNELICENILKYVDNFGKPNTIFALFPESLRKSHTIENKKIILMPQKKSDQKAVWIKKDSAFLHTYKTIYRLEQKLSQLGINFLWSFWDESDQKNIKKYPQIPGYIDINYQKIVDASSPNNGERYYEKARDLAHPGICYNSGVANIFLENFYDKKNS